MNSITINKLSAGYQHTPVVENISLTIEQGESYALLGKSGTGKSTLLQVLAGLLPHTSGTRNGDNPSIGYMLQDHALLPWCSVFDNVALGMRTQNVPKKHISSRAMEALAHVGLADYAQARIEHLSGGQKQRIALARTLAIQPEVLFLDEPFSSLDSLTTHGLLQDIRALVDTHTMTIVFVTHNIDEALYLCNNLVVLAGSPARIVAQHKSPYAGVQALDTHQQNKKIAFATEIQQEYQGLSGAQWATDSDHQHNATALLHTTYQGYAV